MKVTLLTHTPEPEKVIAAAAKLCYSKHADVATLIDSLTQEEVEKFVSKLEESGHESPFEHASFTFALEGVTVAFLKQITRHRHASFSVASQRYIDFTNFEDVMPDAIKNNDEARIAYRFAMADVRSSCEKMQKAGIKNEDIRSILTNSCTTRMIVTMNVRALWNYFKLRCCARAQKEHRQVAMEMLRQCKEVAPVLFRHAGPSCVRGVCPEGKMSCGKAPTLEEVMKVYNKHKE